MTKSVLPEGWSVEQGDPSVGIFGEATYHDACTVSAHDAEAVDVVIAVTRINDHTVSETHYATCTVCDESTIYSTDTYDPVDTGEEEDYFHV